MPKNEMTTFKSENDEPVLEKLKSTMKKMLLWLLAALPVFAQAQNENCDGNRFLTDVFEIDSTMNVVFGNSTSYDGVNADLEMDVYYPIEEVSANRPLLILAHGGSFILGSREDMSWACRDLARKGYVVATIDYRLYDGPLFPIPDSLVMSDVVMKAVSDGKAAVRYFREDAAENGNTFSIDPDMILIGGVSAGAILMDHVAYMDETDDVEEFLLEALEDNGGWEGNSSDNTSYSSAVQGVLSYSGALRSAEYINAGDVPILSVHDDMDEVVPYGDGFATILTIPIIRLNGSGVMAARADEVGVPNELITIENSTGHVSYFGNPTMTNMVLDATYSFLHEIVCPGISFVAENFETIDLKLFPNPASTQVQIEVPGELADGVLSMYNPVGQLVIQQNVARQDLVRLDLSQLAGGLYTVVVQSRDNSGLRGVSRVSVE